MNKSEQIKNEIVQIVREFALAHPHINSPLVNKAKELEVVIISDTFTASPEQKRLEMFEKYIHTNSCSDECGWFAFFTPYEESINDLPEWRVNGCETEEEAIKQLCLQASMTFDEKGWIG